MLYSMAIEKEKRKKERKREREKDASYLARSLTKDTGEERSNLQTERCNLMYISVTSTMIKML